MVEMLTDYILVELWEGYYGLGGLGKEKNTTMLHNCC